MLLNLLQTNPKARERKQKNRAVAFILQKMYPELKGISLDRLQKVIKEANNLDRQWRKILEENPHLRGSDYNDKDELVAKKLEQLGYEVGSGYVNNQLQKHL